MTPASAALPGVAPQAIAVLLHALRLLPTALLCPFLGGPLVPPAIRIALAVSLGACGWLAAGATPVDASPPGLLLAGFRELCVGTALGVVAAMPFEAARSGGRLVDTLRGATLAELHVAPIRQRESATGDLLVQWAVVLAATAGGDRLVVTALLETFRAVPIGAAIRVAPLLDAALRSTAELLACALAVGAPAAAGVLAADLVLAFASRPAPSLQLVAAAQPARAAAGLLAVAVAAAAIAGRLTAAVALSASLVRGAARGALP